MDASTSRQNPWLIVVGIGLLVLVCGACALGAAALGAGYFLASGPTPVVLAPTAIVSVPPTDVPDGELLPGEFTVPDEGAQHVTQGAPIIYDHYPPSSGTHYPRPAAWGVYTDPVPEGTYVHNLEHGGVVVLYNCPDTCSELQGQLQDFYDQAPPEDIFGEVKIVITPYMRELPAPVVAVAWGHQINLEASDADLLLQFYQRYVNVCCESVP
jgi:hypothetical protein